MLMNKEIIYLTGATGTIGSNLRKEIHKLGLRTYICSRHKPELKSNERFLKYYLGDDIPPLKGQYRHIIIHLAHDFGDRREGIENINQKGMQTILNSFKNVESKKIIYISSPDINNKKLTTYTSQKKNIELMLNPDKDLILRPSFIESNNRINNIFKKLTKFVIVMPKNKSRISPIKLDRFSKKVIDLGLKSDGNGTYLLIGKKFVTLSDYLLNKQKTYLIYMPNLLWSMLILFFKVTHNYRLFYLSERILGYIYLRDIDVLIKETSKKIIIDDE